MSDAARLIRGKNVVAVIDFHEAVIYPTDVAPRQRPERLVATDPEGHFHHLTIMPGILPADRGRQSGVLA